MPPEKDNTKTEVKEKTPAELRQEERDGIKVTSSNDENNEEKEELETKGENDDDNNNNDDNDDNGEEKEKKDEKEVLETKDDDDEDTKDPAKIIAKLERKAARLEKRLDKETGNKKDLQRELADTKKALETKHAEGEATYTKEELETEAKRIAKEENEKNEFIKAGNRLAEGVEKVLKLDTKAADKKIADLVEAMDSPIPGHMVAILDEIDNGPAVLAHLIKDHDEAEKVWALTPVKMATALTKLGLKLATPRPKDISNVPAPNERIGGGGGHAPFNAYDTKNNKTKDWIERRNAEVAAKNAAKRGAMH